MTCSETAMRQITTHTSGLKFTLRCLQSRKSRDNLQGYLAQLAASDADVRKKLYALYDGTKESLASLPPVSLFQGGPEAPVKDDVQCNGILLPLCLIHNQLLNAQKHALCCFMLVHQDLSACSRADQKPLSRMTSGATVCHCLVHTHLNNQNFCRCLVEQFHHEL